MSQLPLEIGLSDPPSLQNYLSGPNAEALTALDSVVSGTGPRLLYLWGRPGTGKTHLLHAVCRALGSRRHGFAFVPLLDPTVVPEMLDGLESAELIVIDDLQSVAGRSPWERALFRLYNESERLQRRWLVAGAANLPALDFGLADLRSRLAAGLSIQLRELSDSEREQALRCRAEQRGFELSAEVVEYLMRRYPRGMHELVGLVERLDRSSLAAGRRVTVPFVRNLLDHPTT